MLPAMGTTVGESISKGWKWTKDKKTLTGASLGLLFRAFNTAYPDAIPQQWEEYGYYAIDTIVATGIIDKLWRNRKDIIKWVKARFTKNK